MDPHRGRGLARALIHHCVADARARGADAVLIGAVPGDIAFNSVLPLIKGKAKPRNAIFGSYMGTQRMVTSGGKKLILYPKNKTARLFDLGEAQDASVSRPPGPAPPDWLPTDDLTAA